MHPTEQETPPGSDKPPAPWIRQFFDEIGPFVTLGLQLAVAVLVFFFIGRWIDSRLDTSPIFQVVGAVLGVVGGMIKFFRTALAIGKHKNSLSKKNEH